MFKPHISAAGTFVNFNIATEKLKIYFVFIEKK